ncbi:holo-ACP synthase [uncultured Desulfovibrio sp.]|uniref:holo-ACP synthase n=1 Tax=uncultured Desulfovibrio sp. TaxID=167968 RepID=UPI0025F9204D|nr:holo-ACP synthase [uncultured Desulfovibrio sp.]
MVVGMGTDIVEVDRVAAGLERFGRRYAARILSPAELALLAPGGGLPSAARLAGRFAAKEAAVKALGTGFSAGIGLHDVEILADAGGGPRLCLSGQAGARRQRLGARSLHVSISHERHYAVAVVILEK